MEVRLIPAPIDITFAPDPEGDPEFKREFDSLSETDNDPVGQWLKMAKARGETKESDPVLLTLLVELHRKVDLLTERIRGEETVRIDLAHDGRISGINYDYFGLKKPMFQAGIRYYGRINMPAFPQREIPAYFTALSESTVHINLMHERDKKEWDGYVASRERAMIREMKGSNQ